MGHHTDTVLKNSYLKVPVNPLSRLPSASYERTAKEDIRLGNAPIAIVNDDRNPLSFREFYKSIPDYKEVNHLSNREFYLKLENLRRNKNKLLLRCKFNISHDDQTLHDKDIIGFNSENSPDVFLRNDDIFVNRKDLNKKLDDKYYKLNNKESDIDNMMDAISDIESVLSMDNVVKSDPKYNKLSVDDSRKHKYNNDSSDMILGSGKVGSKRNSPSSHSVCRFNEVSSPLKLDFNSDLYKNITLYNENNWQKNKDFYKTSQSVPTSPIKKMYSPDMSCLTVPQPFKMTERDDAKRMINEMKTYSRDLENTFLKKEEKNKPFKANPVPIESRILLYDKILQDQELRRSISKLQSTAELQAQMKPFKFTEREEKWINNRSMGCRRLCRSNPQLALSSSISESDLFRRKKFRAKPVPKNLFSNYIYEKMREDDFYRALNRRIRSEEMLKASSLPPSMAKREKTRREPSPSKCRKYHNMYNMENDSEENSINGVKKKQKSNLTKKMISREIKLESEMENLKDELISPNAISDKTRKGNQEAELKKIYGSSSSEPTTSSLSSVSRPKSSINGHSINRSNLAAVLRIESSKKKLEADMLKQLAEDRYQSEIKWRNSVLRRNPAWKSIKYNHAEDLAMRLQLRRDEERMRREQFLHDMELMYGRVHRQPMMFERIYCPHRGIRKNSFSKINERSKSKEKPKSALSKRVSSSDMMSPNRTRKVSINETAETIVDDVEDYSYKDSYEDDMSRSSDEIPESIPEQLEREEK